MKNLIKFILIFLLFFQTIKTQGQTYFKMLEPDKIWNFYNCYSGPGADYSTLYSIGMDTLIQGKTYSKILISHDSVVWQKSDFYLREVVDSQRIYLLYNQYEGLLYDFNIGVGDSVLLDNKLYGNQIEKYIVHSIDSILIDGSFRKIIYFDTDKLHFWLQGVGDSFGLEFPGATGTGYCHRLVCFYQDNNFLFLSPDYQNCFFQFLNTDEIAKENFTISYLNNEQLAISSNNDFLNKIEIFNLQGVSLHKSEYRSKKIILGMEKWPKGVFIVRIFSEKKCTNRYIYHF